MVQKPLAFRLREDLRLSLLAYGDKDNKKLITATDRARTVGGDAAH